MAGQYMGSCDALELVCPAATGSVRKNRTNQVAFVAGVPSGSQLIGNFGQPVKLTITADLTAGDRIHMRFGPTGLAAATTNDFPLYGRPIAGGLLAIDPVSLWVPMGDIVEWRFIGGALAAGTLYWYINTL